MATIGDKIREIRLQRGLTQSDLSADLVTPSMISQIESDKAKPSYPLLTAIANRLGMPVEYFLSDLEHQFDLSARIRLAEYYLLTEHGEKALQILSAVERPESPGLSYQEYYMALARAYHATGRRWDAVRVLEDLREQALRTQDAKLHLFVCKESGQVEYAMNNVTGAIYEWRKAANLGESMAETDDFMTVQVQGYLTEIYYSLYKAYLQSGDTEVAADCLAKAKQYSNQSASLSDIAETLVRDGVASLEQNDPARAKASIDTAVTVVESARLIQQHILISSREEPHRTLDPWTQAAIATTAVNPGPFLETELLRIEQDLERQQLAAAQRRVDRCLDILEEYSADSSQMARANENYRFRFLCHKAFTMYLGNDVDGAIGMLEGIGQDLQKRNRMQELLQVWARLLQWYAEQNRSQALLALSEALHDLCQHVMEQNEK